MKCTIVAAAFVSLSLISAWAQELQPTLTLAVEEIARQVQSRNLEIFKAERNVERAREDLIGKPELVDSRLSIGSDYPFTGVGSSLSLPIIPQLSVDGGVAVAPVDGEVLVAVEPFRLTVKPFEPSRRTYAEERVFRSAVVKERHLRRKTHLDGEKAALNLLVRDMKRELARGTEELEQNKYELAQRRLELGEASFQDVQDVLVDLLEAREDLYDSERKYLGDWKTLQLLFAPSEERIGVAPLSIEELSELVQVRRQEMERYLDVVPATEKLQTLNFELVALQEELKAIPAWRPDLNLAAAVPIPSFYPSLSVSLSFSPNQLKGDEREDLEEDIEVKRMEIAAETSAAALQKSLELQNIALVEQALAGARIQGERDAVALQEAKLLFQQGRRTSLELEQLRLNLRRTRIRLFQATVEVYGALGEYLLLFVDE